MCIMVVMGSKIADFFFFLISQKIQESIEIKFHILE